MRIYKRCPACNEPLAKSTAEPDGVLLLGKVLIFPGTAAVICPKCKERHPLDGSFAAPLRQAVILPDRPALRR